MGVIVSPATFVHVVRPHFFIMTGSVCGAILLNYFDQWQSSVGVGKWFYRKQEDMVKDLFGMFAVRQIRAEIDSLVDGELLLWRNNPTIAQVKTRQYQLNTPLIQRITDEVLNGIGAQYVIGQELHFEGAESEPPRDTNGTLKVQKVYFEGAEIAPSNNRYKQQKQKQKHATDATTETTAQARNDVVVTPLDGGNEDLLLRLEKQGIKRGIAVAFVSLPPDEIDRAIDASASKGNKTGFLVKALKERWYKAEAQPVTPEAVRDACGLAYELSPRWGWLVNTGESVVAKATKLKDKAIEMGLSPKQVFEYFGISESEDGNELL